MTGIPSFGLRERKRAACAAQIHEAAVRLVDEHGYEAVTVAHIAEAADVSAKTVFNYWGSKDGAIIGLAEDGMSQTWADTYLAPDTTDVFGPIVDLFAARSSNQTQEHAQRMMRVFREQPRLGGLRLAHTQRLTEELTSVCAQKLRQRRTGAPDEALVPEARLLVNIALVIVRNAWSEWALSGAATRFQDHIARSAALHKELCADFSGNTGFLDGRGPYEASGGKP